MFNISIVKSLEVIIDNKIVQSVIQTIKKHVRNDLYLYLRVELLMKVNGQEIKEMEEVYKYGRIVLDMMVNGQIIRHVEEDHFIMQMEMLILENGLKIELMDMDFINRKMEQFMQDIGKMIYNMVKVKKNVSE